MDLMTFASLARSTDIAALLRLPALIQPFYRVAFLCGAAKSGILQQMAGAPVSVDELATRLDISAKRTRALELWLEIGAGLGELRKSEGRYQIAGRFSRLLSNSRFEALSGAIEEVGLFHYRVLIDGPHLLRSGGTLGLGDQDGEVIARSSRILQPFVEEGMRWAIPKTESVAILDVGCGLGHQLRYAAELNATATLTGLELQPGVAAAARQDLAGSRHRDRIVVLDGDVRNLSNAPVYDLVMLHNNIYYFDPASRVDTLALLRRQLKPSGSLLLTTSCGGGPLGVEVLNFWWSLAQPGGPLPGADELTSQLKAAGFSQVQRKKLVPGSSFYAFRGVVN